MASNFDRGKYKDTFEKRYGSGTYDSGLSKARDIGVKKAQAQFEETKFKARMSEVKSEQKKVAKKKKEEEDNLKLLQEAKAANDKKKDNSFMNKNVVKPFKNFLGDVSKDTKGVAKDLLSNFTANKQLNPSQKAEMERIKKQGFQESYKKGELTLGDKTESRFQNQAQNAFSFGGRKEKLLKNIKDNPDNKELKKEYEKFYGGDRKGTDVLAQILGYGAGGLLGGGVVRGAGLGAKGLGALGKTLTKEAAKKIAIQTAKEGSIVGGLMGGAEVATRERYNPEDYNWKQNAGQVALEAGAGAVLDPLVSLIKPAFKAASEGVAKSAIKSSQKSLTDLVPAIKATPKMDLLPVPSVKPPTSKMRFGDIDNSEVPFTGGESNSRLETLLPAVSQTAATSTRPRYDVDVLMKAYKGQDVSNIPMKRVEPSAIGKVDDLPNNPYESVIDAPVKKVDAVGKPVKVKVDRNKKFKDLADNAILNSDLWKDKGPLRYGRETLERNFEDIAGKADGQFLKDNYVQPVRQKETERIRYVNSLRDDVKSLGIKAKSKDDQLTQMYGEKKLSLENLKKETPNWEKVKQAADWHTNNYKNVIAKVNKILDDAGEPTIPILENYFPHYQEVEGIFAKLKKAGFNVENNTLPTGINGLTENFKPNKKFFAHALRRTSDETTFGAIEGFDRYIEGVSQLMYHTENIKNVRALENAIRDKHGDSTHLTNLVPYLKEHGNLMAGKKANIDRVIEEKVGRKAYNALDTIKQRTGLNMLGYSVSSASSALIPLTQAAATTSTKSFIKGMADTVTNIVRKDGFADKSGFLTRRVGSKPLVRTTWNKIENNSMAMMDMVDRFTSQTIVRGKYYELLDKGMPEAEALKQADDWAGRVMTDRSKGQQPTMFNAKTLGPLLQFQVEVNNQLSFIFKDIPKNAKNKAQLASQMTQVLVYSYLANEVYEQVLGRRPAFDPAGVAQEAYKNFTNEEMDSKESTGKFLKEVAGQLPFTSTFTGGRYPITSALPSLNIDDYTQGKTTIGKEAIKPLKYLVLPAGGSQANKIYEGSKILKDEGVYTDKGNLKYPVENNTSNLLKGLILGKSSLPETVEYYDKPFNQRRSLGSNQTKDYEYAKSKGLGNEFYDTTILNRTEKGKKDKMNAARKEIDEIEKDTTLTDKERKKRIDKIMKSIGK